MLKVILWKNLLLRKRHCLLTFTEIALPILLFTAITFGRAEIPGLKKQIVDQAIHHDSISVEDVYNFLNVDNLNLLYSPSSNFTDSLMYDVRNKFLIPADVVTTFQDQNALLTHFEKHHVNLTTIIMFHSTNEEHLDYELTIYDKSLNWKTDRLFDYQQKAEERRQSNYLHKGYVAWQSAIDLAYIEHMQIKKNLKPVPVRFNLEEFPEPPHTVDSGIHKLFMTFLPLITIFSFIFLFPSVLQRVGEERASGTKEFMKMLGLKSSTIWIGWFIHALITTIPSVIVIVVLMKVPVWQVDYPLIERSDFTVLSLFLILYSTTTITCCFFMATLFKKPSIATVVGILIWIFSYFIPQAVMSSHECMHWFYKIFIALIPNMALYFGYTSISEYETREIGIQWNTLFSPGSGDTNDITMGCVLIILLVDTIVFMLLTLYVENVSPGKYGIPKTYFFLLTSALNFFSCSKWRHKGVSNCDEGQELVEKGSNSSGIDIRNLRKVYNYSHKVALNDLNLKIKKNHITVLLGQNGAGKTTTMSILTGMINATSGEVLINGKNIENDDLRKSIGLCPQHNLLFQDLTVTEHLQFIAKLKGIKQPKEEIKDTLNKLGIYEKKNYFVSVLSGGMKRKLCLGMALMGNSEILILDEPTSGMDPESCRKVWNLLKQNESKTILISTHFMEEADVLGDYIAILNNGQLQDYGTPLDLKAKYNTGIHLSILLKRESDEESTTLKMERVQSITSLVKRNICNVQVKTASNSSIIFLLPHDDKTKVRDLLNALEEHDDVESITINETTLNDVFLGSHEKHNKKDEHSLAIAEDTRVEWSEKAKSWSCYILCALLVKRWYFLKRKFALFFPILTITISIILLALWLSTSNSNYSGGGPSFNFSLNKYGDTKVVYGKDLNTTSHLETIFQNVVIFTAGVVPFYSENVLNEIIRTGIDNIVYFKKHMVVAAEFQRQDDVLEVKAMYSYDALHSIPISINLAMNTILKLTCENCSISTTNSPVMPLNMLRTPSELSAVDVTVVWQILLPISMCFFMSFYIIFPHSEISTKFLKIQITAGVNIFTYWFSNLLFDGVFASMALGVIYGIVYSLSWFSSNSIFHASDLAWLFFIFGVFVILSLPCTYILGYRKSVCEGFGYLLVVSIILGIVPTLIFAACDLSSNGFMKTLEDNCSYVLNLTNPYFALSRIIFKFSTKFTENYNWQHMELAKKNHICNTNPNPCCIGSETESCDLYQSYWNYNIGTEVTFLEMFGGSVLHFIVLLGLSIFKKPFRSCFASENVDELNKISGSIFQVQKLDKKLNKIKILKEMAFHLKQKQCFGLLGVNGAGKSTTFKILTKWLKYDVGDIRLQDEKNNINIHHKEYITKVGYCPQENCLNFALSGEELLITMIRIKGFWSNAKEKTGALLKSFDLDKYGATPCGHYSGGNKRKLNTAFAFIGTPKVIFLDEPTSGVDPVGRREFWKVLSLKKQTDNSAMILCSHSMEECENLCQYVAIMKQGKIEKCGSLPKLKSECKTGVKITMKLNKKFKLTNKVKEEHDLTNNLKLVDKFKLIHKLKEKLNKLNIKILKQYGQTLICRAENTTQKLSTIFNEVQKLKDDLRGEHALKEDVIEDYMINQISLEDIFMATAEDSTNQLDSE